MATGSARGQKTAVGGASDEALVSATLAYGRVVVVPSTLWERDDDNAVTIGRLGEAKLPGTMRCIAAAPHTAVGMDKFFGVLRRRWLR